VKVCDPLDRRALVPGPHRNRKPKRPPTEFRAALQQALLPHLHETELKFDNVTRLTGINRQSLQRKLKASGTAFSADLIALKKRRACEDSIQSDQPIAEIAASIGFANPISFTRAFRLSTSAPDRALIQTLLDVLQDLRLLLRCGNVRLPV
jgi:AraC-like DNA-binding protein